VTPRIQVLHVEGSTLAGRRSGHAVGSVHVGRAPGNDVQFDPHEDRLVSSRHLRLDISTSGDLTVTDLDSANGTFIDGQPLRGMAVVPGHARIECGRGGPVIRAWLGRDDSPPPPAPNARHGEGAHAPWRAHPSQAGPVGSSQGAPPKFADRFSKGAVPAAASSPAAARGPAARPGRSASPEAPTSVRRAPQQATVASGPAREKTGLGRTTMLGMLGEHRTRMRRSQVLMFVLVLVLVGGAAALVSSRDAPAPEPADTPKRVVEVVTPPARITPPPAAHEPRPAVGWPKVMASLRQRVYLVLLRDPTGRERKVGTAWSVDRERGLLATNAHVAETFGNLQSGQTLLARSSGDPLVDLDIEGVELHPGYEAFERDSSQLQPLSDTHGGWRLLVNPYDVALMRVKGSQARNQAPALQLAAHEKLMALSGGEDLAYAGFPLEGQVGGGTDKDRPACNSNRFALSRVTNPFFGRPERPEEAHVLTYSMIITGGASGSPVVDEAGHVIGLVSAGNFWGHSRGARVTGGGICYGPRADLVAELRDGTAAAKAAARAVRDRKELERIWEENEPTEQRLLVAGAYALKYDSRRDAAADITLVAKRLVRASLRRAAEFAPRAPGAGEYGLLVASLDSPAGLSVQVGSERVNVGSWYRIFPFRIGRGGGTVATSVRLRPRSADQASGRVLIALYRVE
jgi:S1-C subfamily serine protease